MHLFGPWRLCRLRRSLPLLLLLWLLSLPLLRGRFRRTSPSGTGSLLRWRRAGIRTRCRSGAFRRCRTRRGRLELSWIILGCTRRRGLARGRPTICRSRYCRSVCARTAPGGLVLRRHASSRHSLSWHSSSWHYASAGKLPGFRCCRDRRTSVIYGRQEFMVLTGGALLI